MITAVVLAKNEERNIKDCLKSLSWTDEIILIDDFSEDKTVKIAEKRDAKIWKRRLSNDFSAQRNFGLKKAKGEWVLFVDADERVSLKLAREIKKVIKQDGAVSGFYLKREDWLWGKPLKYGETASVRLLRLGRKKAGRWQRRVHEVWEISGKTDILKNKIIHFPHQSVDEFLKHINFHSSLHAKALGERGERGSLWQIIFYPTGKFILNYFLKRGFLDKERGLIVALMMSLHSFLARAKLFLDEKSN